MSFSFQASQSTLTTIDAPEGPFSFRDFVPGTEELGVNCSGRSASALTRLLGFSSDPVDGFGEAAAVDFRDALAALPREEDQTLRQYLGALTLLAETTVVRDRSAVITWG